MLGIKSFLSAGISEMDPENGPDLQETVAIIPQHQLVPHSDDYSTSSHSKTLTLNYLQFLISRNSSQASLVKSSLMLDSLCLKTLSAALSSCLLRCQKKRRQRGGRQPGLLLSWRSRRPRRWSILFWRKGPRIWVSDRTSSPKETSLVLSNHYIWLQWQRAIPCKCLKVPHVIDQFAQALDGQTATKLLTLTHRHRPDTK